ncbi:MAG: hypothetical protein LUF35_08465 [Lachnospiraceae bacterium]|nr:hypothetical protein [Lachnospiraceae bacterium]
MAKKVRFPLEMEDGAEVRSVEELREHFSLRKVLAYIADGKMISWLRDRYEDDLAEAVEALDSSDPLLSKKVCEIFNVSCETPTEIDMKILTERSWKLTLLKEFTADLEILAHVDDVAVTQDDIYDLLDDGKTEIYLCGEQFTIPLAKQGIRYIGVNQPIVVVRSSEPVDWEMKRIALVGVRFDAKYQSIVDSVEVREKSTDTNQPEDEKVRSDFYGHIENFREKGIYGLKGSEFQLIHARTGDVYRPDLEYHRGMAQDGANLYLTREKEPYSKTYELVRLNTSSDTWTSLYYLGSRDMEILDKKREYIFFLSMDINQARIMVLDINTLTEKTICLEDRPESHAIRLSGSGRQAYYLNQTRNSIRRIDIDRETTETILKKSGINDFSVCKDKIIFCGRDYDHQGVSDRPIYVMALDLKTKEITELCPSSGVDGYGIQMATMIGEKIFMLRDDLNYGHSDYYEIWSIDMSADMEPKRNAARLDKNVRYAKRSGVDLGNEMWIQDGYLYIGIRNSDRFPMYRLHLATNRLEKIQGFKYEAV